MIIIKNFNNCINCGSHPMVKSERTFIECSTYIRCPICRRQTNIHFSFWSSDAYDAAKREWNILNPE